MHVRDILCKLQTENSIQSRVEMLYNAGVPATVYWKNRNSPRYLVAWLRVHTHVHMHMQLE